MPQNSYPVGVQADAMLRRANRAAALLAANEAGYPLMIEAADIEDYNAGDLEALDLPFLGDGKVEGWRKVNSFLVHQGGPLVAMNYSAAFEPGYAYGIVLEMPFQYVVGVYERVER
jgi:hypothetical protein